MIRHGRLLFRAQQDLARCKEQLQVLPVELARFRAWAEHVCAGVDAAIAALQPSGATLDGAPAAEGAAACRDAGWEGKVFILKEHREWLQDQLKGVARVEAEWAQVGAWRR